MDYEQVYIDTLWKELEILPDADGDFKIDGNHLHIWPRKDFMFIAIPSPVTASPPLHPAPGGFF